MGKAIKGIKKLNLENNYFKFLPIIFVFLLVLIFSFPYWAKGLIPFPSTYLATFFPPWQYYYGMPVKNNAMPDVITQMYPFKHLVIELWKNGQIPLWNPYNFSGNPLLANYQSAVFHPANILFFILPEVDAWSIMILLQPLLAGFFTYLFARQLKLSKSSALLSAISFMFCGFITCWMAYGTMSWALLWLPLILYAIEKNFQRIKAINLVLISFSLAASFFSGHFQISLYVLLASICYLIFRFLTSGDFKRFLICFLFLFFGILLAFPQILPSLELHNLSVRKDAFVIGERIPWRYLPTLFAPDFYGNPVTRNDWFGHYAEWSGFTGVIPLILAFYLLWQKKNHFSVLFFGFLAFFSFILGRETPLLDWLEKLKIPVFSTSAAARINSLFSFSIAILGGWGLEKLKENINFKKNKSPFLYLILGISFFLIIWGWLWWGEPFPEDKLLIAKRNLILPTILAFGFFGIFLGISFFQKYFRKEAARKIFKNGVVFIILFLSAFDLFRFAWKWMPFDPKEYVYLNLPVLDFLTAETPPNRVFGFFGMEMQNYFKIFGLEGYDPLFIQRYGEFLIASSNGKIGRPSGRGVSLDKRGKNTLKILNLLGVKYILHAIPDDRHIWAFNWWDYPEQFQEVYYEENKYQIFENLKAFPRAFLVYDYKVIKDSQEIINQMFSENIDLRNVLILEEKPNISSNSPKNLGVAEITYYSPNWVKIKVKTENEGFLFLSDNYYPGWIAKIDGKLTKIYRANYSFRAIEVPDGEHQIDFIYQPKSFKIGLVISLITLFITLTTGLIYANRYF